MHLNYFRCNKIRITNALRGLYYQNSVRKPSSFRNCVIVSQIFEGIEIFSYAAINYSISIFQVSNLRLFGRKRKNYETKFSTTQTPLFFVIPKKNSARAGIHQLETKITFRAKKGHSHKFCFFL